MNASFSTVKKGMNQQTIGRLGRYITSSKTLLLYPIFFPFLMILYVVTSSVMNKNSSGIVYLLGLLLTMFNNLLVNSMDYRETENYMRSDMCYAGIPFVSKYTNLSSPNTAVIVYTFFFFLSPAFLRNMHFIRSPLGLLDFFITRFKEVIIFFGIVLFLNCSNVEMNGVDIMNGMFVGMFSSWLYILIYYVTGNKNIIMNNTFLNNQVLCDIPKNKTFKCDRGGETSKIIFSQSEKKVPIIDEEYFYGDDDLMNLKTIKNYSTYRYVHIYGKTSLIIYTKENYRGDKLLIKYKDLKEYNITKSSNGKEYIIIPKSALLTSCNWLPKNKDGTCPLENFKSIESIQLIKEQDF